MKVIVAYVVVSQGQLTTEWASRFAVTYRMFDPGFPHQLLVICNGGEPPESVKLLFEGLDATFWPRENDPGWDISAYINAARGPAMGADLLVCLGETCYAHKPGWLGRIEDAAQRYGSGMYGIFSSNVVRAHMNTTGFACHPKLLHEFPYPIRTRGDRYVFEHGQNSFWRYVKHRGLPVKLVTWDGEWDPPQWRTPLNILWRGDQSNCLLWANHSDAYANADVLTRAAWSRNTDQPPKDLS